MEVIFSFGTNETRAGDWMESTKDARFLSIGEIAALLDLRPELAQDSPQPSMATGARRAQMRGAAAGLLGHE